MRHETMVITGRGAGAWRGAAGWLVGPLLGLVLACTGSDGPTRPEDPDPPLPPSPFLVSNPVTAPPPATAAGPLYSAGDATVVYVSLPPGSLPEASQVSIRDARLGSAVTVPVVGGGFDPVALASAVGDTLDFLVQGENGASLAAYRKLVEKERPPAVVRTTPPPNKRDVPLNAFIEVTFSEPMDSASVVAGVRLRAGGIDVPGTVVAVSSGGGILRATFTPSAPLEPLTDYQLVVDVGVRDRDGEALPAAVGSGFTTGDAGLDEVAPQVTVADPVPGEAMPTAFASVTFSMAFDDEVVGLTLELLDEGTGEFMPHAGVGFGPGDGSGGLPAASFSGLPLRWFLNTAFLPAGSHTVRLTAHDLAGNAGSSAPFELELVEPVPGPDPGLQVLAFSVVETEGEQARWLYSPQLTDAAEAAGAGIKVLGFEMLEIPGLAPPFPALYANGLSVAAGAEAELFRDFYGDYAVSFSGWELQRATSGTATARLTYRDGTGTIRQLTLEAPIVPGGPPGSHTGGTCAQWVIGLVMAPCTP